MEKIRINKNVMVITVKVYKWLDNDHQIIYSPSLHLSGYGASQKEAYEMFKLNVEELAKNVFQLSPRKRYEFLLKEGWQREKLKNKNFSKTFIDETGVLRDFDLTPDQLKSVVQEEMELTV